MPSIARRLHRPRSRPRAAVASLSALFVIALLGVVPAIAAPAVPGPGFQDFQYNTGPDFSTGGDAVTGSRNQSKVWFNDGRWFGLLFDKTGATNTSYRIQTLNMATQTWTTGGTATQVDKRAKSHGDVLSDGNTLWIVSSHKSGTNISPNGDLRVYKFSYNGTTHTYNPVDLDPGSLNNYDVIAQGGTDAATIAKAPNGRIWVAYTQDDPSPAITSHVRVVSSTTSAGTTWNAPQELTGGTSGITTNDLAAIVTINNGVGVFWSNQTVGDEAYYFQVHLDASGDTTWQTRETAYNGSAQADGHLSVKVDSTGRVLAAVKTKGTTTEPLIGVLSRTTGGSWAMHEVDDAVGTPDPTRPIVVIDEEANEADVFMTNQVDGGWITRRTAPLDTLNFGAPSEGAAFIKSSADPAISDATSSKQPATIASGILVLASDRTETPVVRRYLHGCAGSVCPSTPVAAFSGTPLTGEGPLAVQFTDASTGAPASWAWDFGDGGTSTLQNPSHTFNPGTWTVSLTVTNALGSDIETKTDYVDLSVPTAATYTAIDPTRLLDTRTGNGLSGKFAAGTPRTFQITGRGDVPANAVAITGNLAVVGQSKAGYVALGPTPTSSPTSSTINFPSGDIRANAVTVSLSDTGELSAVYMASPGATTHLVLDVTGYFVRDTAGSTYHAFDPARVLDSRTGVGLSGKFSDSTPRTFAVAGQGGVPVGAVAVTGNVTVVNQSKAGYVAVGPGVSASPAFSTLNFPTGDTRGNAVTVALDGSGNLGAVYKATPGATTNLVFDVTGYFLHDLTGTRYIPLEPVRLLDTRTGNGLTGKFVSGTPRPWDIAGIGGVPADAEAVTGNLTVVSQSKAGYVALGPTVTSNPPFSTLNFPLGDTRGNAVSVDLSDTGQLDAVYKAASGATTHLILDVTGYYK